MTEHEPTRLLQTPEQVGEMLGISANWLRTNARKGRIQHTRLGRRLMFSAEDVAAVLAGHRRTPDEPSAMPTPRGRRRSA